MICTHMLMLHPTEAAISNTEYTVELHFHEVRGYATPATVMVPCFFAVAYALNDRGMLDATDGILALTRSK